MARKAQPTETYQLDDAIALSAFDLDYVNEGLHHLK